MDFHQTLCKLLTIRKGTRKITKLHPHAQMSAHTYTYAVDKQNNAAVVAYM